MSILHLKNEDVDSNLNLKFTHQNLPVLVFVYADWCGHCQHAKPNVLKLKQELEQEKTGFVIAVDSTAESELAKRLDVEGYPSFFLVNGNSNKLENISDEVGDRSCNALRRAMKL